MGLPRVSGIIKYTQKIEINPNAASEMSSYPEVESRRPLTDIADLDPQVGELLILKIGVDGDNKHDGTLLTCLTESNSL
jgi:hypothetical protein